MEAARRVVGCVDGQVARNTQLDRRVGVAPSPQKWWCSRFARRAKPMSRGPAAGSAVEIFRKPLPPLRCSQGQEGT
jgi:hypothetical protein